LKNQQGWANGPALNNLIMRMLAGKTIEIKIKK
jgi:hypothetical protein